MTFQRIVNFLKGIGNPESTRQISMLYSLRGGMVLSNGNIPYLKAVHEGYKNIVWVYRCISAHATALSSVPWKVYKTSRTGEETHIPNHPIELMMNAPNPYFGRRELFESFCFGLALGGRAFWEVIFVRGKPYRLYPIRCDWMYPLPDPIHYIRGWKFDPRGTEKPIEFPPEEIIDFRFLDPVDEYGAMSPLTAATRTMETENAAISWNKALLDNGAVPGGIIKVPAQTLQNVKKAEIKASIDEEFTGDGRYRTMVLWGGMEWQKMGLDHSQMQFLDQRKVDKFEICAILETPAQIVGANEDPTYSNYEIARLSWWEDTLIPRLEWIKSKINSRITPYFGKDLVTSYDLSGVPAMRQAFGKQVESAKALYTMGYPINAINRRLSLGMPNVPWGDVAFIPVSSQPVTAVVDEDGKPIAPAPLPEPSSPAADDEDENPGDPEDEDDGKLVDPYKLTRAPRRVASPTVQ